MAITDAKFGNLDNLGVGPNFSAIQLMKRSPTDSTSSTKWPKNSGKNSSQVSLRDPFDPSKELRLKPLRAGYAVQINGKNIPIPNGYSKEEKRVDDYGNIERVKVLDLRKVQRFINAWADKSLRDGLLQIPDSRLQGQLRHVPPAIPPK
jgi:hypothetical protein